MGHFLSHGVGLVLWLEYGVVLVQAARVCKVLVLFKREQVAVVAEYLFLGGIVVTLKLVIQNFVLGVAESLFLGGIVVTLKLVVLELYFGVAEYLFLGGIVVTVKLVTLKF